MGIVNGKASEADGVQSDGSPFPKRARLRMLTEGVGAHALEPHPVVPGAEMMGAHLRLHGRAVVEVLRPVLSLPAKVIPEVEARIQDLLTVCTSQGDLPDSVMLE